MRYEAIVIGDLDKEHAKVRILEGKTGTVRTGSG